MIWCYGVNGAIGVSGVIDVNGVNGASGVSGVIDSRNQAYSLTHQINPAKAQFYTSLNDGDDEVAVIEMDGVDSLKGVSGVIGVDFT